MEGTVKCAANYVPLTPISFLQRAALVYPDHTSLVYGCRRYSWRETRGRCLRLASALSNLGVSRGHVVAVLAPNVPAMYELHFGVPMTGGILCTLNTRHDPKMVSVLLRHAEAKIIFVDYQLLQVAEKALCLLSQQNITPPLLVHIAEFSDTLPVITNHVSLSSIEYESLLDMGKPSFEIRWPVDECDPISLNYTSGTTASPKGVIYSHRGAYLNAIMTILLNDMTALPVYLWTVPMFHCNGWCLPWGIAALGGTNICIRNFTARSLFDNIIAHKVTHMGGAPTVLNMIVNSLVAEQKPLPGRVIMMTGAAPPPPQVLFKMEELGFHVVHAYGLTETYGPGTVCTWKPEWDLLPALDRAELKSRQGLQHIGMEEVDIRDPVTMESVPADGKTMGEIMFRGNTVMNGYYKDVKATKEVFANGWFKTGDLAVRHEDGYIKIKDRSKDIIISGGENISTVEVEAVLFSHPAVLEASVVGRPDDHWGETPCAFVKLKEGTHATAEDIIQYCRSRLPHYMAPRTVVFDDLPKTSTGKVQKFVLRDKAKAMGSLTTRSQSKL